MESVKINIAGDFCVGQLNNLHLGESLKQLLVDSDINIVNMEGPVLCEDAYPIQKSGPHLFQDSQVPAFLEANGFNLISLANNHIMDYGESALKETLKSFTKATVMGAGSFDEAYKYRFYIIKNRRIAFLCFTQHEFGVLDEIVYNKNKIGTAWLCHPCIDELIVEAKHNCDYLVIIPHAGCEYFEYPLPELRTLYRHFISMGADAVIGGHPHVPQCWEFYEEKPIVYSLGNFCFDMPANDRKNWFKGLMVQLSIAGSSIGLTIHYIDFKKELRTIDVSKDKSLEPQLKRINDIFRDEKMYIDAVNKKCLALRSHYLNLFELSGYYKLTPRKLLRAMVNTLKKVFTPHTNNIFDSPHLINNLRCEPHRWIISRIYELESNDIGFYNGNSQKN